MNPTDISEDDLAGLSDEERSAIGTNDDNDDLAELAGTDDADAGAPAAEDAAAQPAPAEPDEPFDVVAPYRAEAPSDAGQKIDALQAQIDDAFTKLMNGDLTAEEYKAQANEAQRQIEELRTAQLKAQIAADMAAQAAQQAWDRACERFAEQVKKTDGIDYFANHILGAAWDAEIKRLANDPANADKSPSFFLREAHAAVMKAIGREPGKLHPQTQQGEAVGDATAARRPDLSAVPPTLSKMPPAMEPSVGEDEFAYLRGLSGDDYEKAVARIEADPEKYARFIATV